MAGYGKAMLIAKSQSKETEENLMVFFDAEEGNKGYFIKEEDTFYATADDEQQEIALWYNGEIIQEW